MVTKRKRMLTKKVRNTLGATVLVLGLASLLGCLSMGGSDLRPGWSRFIEGQPAADLLQYKSIGYMITVPNSENQPEADQFAVGAAQVTARLFETAVDLSKQPGTKTDLLMEINIDELKKVTRQQRTWSAVMAGPAIMGLSIVVTEADSGKVVSAGSVGGSTTNHLVNGEITEDAINNAIGFFEKYLKGQAE